MNIFCFGFGQVAQNFLNKIKLENIEVELNVTSRSKSQKKNIGKLSYECFQFNDNLFDKDLISKLKNSDHILISIPPINGEDVVIKNFLKFISESKSKWITYLSATSVYGDHQGKWVDENSNTFPTSTHGVNRLKAEKSWMELAVSKKIPLQIFRLSGIYSNKKNVLTRLKSGNAKIVNMKDHYFSRIHVEDIANVLFKSLTNFKSQEIYNISDDKPASTKEITQYGMKLLGIKENSSIDVKEIQSEMLKSFYNESKKVSNKKMKKIFNYELKFPTYIEGLSYIRDNSI